MNLLLFTHILMISINEWLLMFCFNSSYLQLSNRIHYHDISWIKYFVHPYPHYSDVIMETIASQITSLTIVYSTVYSDPDQRKYQSYASMAFVRGIHRGPVNSPHKWPVTRKMFPFDDVIMHGCNLDPMKFVKEVQGEMFFYPGVQCSFW